MRVDARHTALLAAASARAFDRPRFDDLGLPLHLELPGITPHEEGLHGALRRLVDEDRSRLGEALQPRGDVDGVAEGRVLDVAAAAELAHYDGAGRGAHPDAEALETPTAQHFTPVPVHLRDDPQRSTDGALGVVLPCRGRTEECEHPVACEVLDMPAECFDLADDSSDRLADDELDVFRLEPLAQRRRADNVGKQCREDLALLANCSRSRGGGLAHSNR